MLLRLFSWSQELHLDSQDEAPKEQRQILFASSVLDQSHTQTDFRQIGIPDVL